MAAFTKELEYEANQLLFNLNVPAKNRNMAFKIGKPDPVVIEKCAPNSLFAGSSFIGNQSLPFSAVSEDSLNIAVKLAKRDIEKQKEEEAMKKNKPRAKEVPRGRATSPTHARSKRFSNASKTKVLQNKSTKDKAKKKPQGYNNKALPNKQSSRGTLRSGDVTPPQAVMRHAMPVTTNSPPTRDVRITLTGDEKIMHEIKRLREEMDKCMIQIKDIEQAAKAAPAASKPKYAEEIEEERKRKVRAEEQTSRASRKIYMLNQQVKDIQGEINRMNSAGAQGVKYNRKSQILTKLAAAHRGAVRVLQNFVSHLPDYDLKQGVPRSYQELGLFLRQLALCCAQLEVAGQGDVPENVMYLFQDMADLNKMIDESITKPANSPQRLCREPRQHPPRSPSPGGARRGPPESRDGVRRKKEVGFEEEVEDDLTTASNSAFMLEKLREPEKVASARERALKAGIQALVEAASAPTTPRTPRLCTQHQSRNTRKRSPVPPLNLPTTPRSPHSPRRARSPADTLRHSPRRARSPADTLRERNQKIKKGLLYPSNIQSQRDRTHRQLLDLGEAHYAEPTFSSRVKEVLPNEFNSLREGSPVSPRRSGSPVTQKRHTEKSDIARQVWLDREYGRRELDELERKVQDRQKIEDISARLGRSPDWVARAEKRLKSKMEPLLAQAEVELNADLLADMLMRDMVTDTAEAVLDMQHDKVLSHDAMAMQDAPSLETMLQKLHSMENEQNDIRRRWATIVYEDQFEENAKRINHRPKSPQPIEITHSDPVNDPVTGIVDARFNTESTSDGAILFTKSRAPTSRHENLELSARGHEQGHERGHYDEVLTTILGTDIPPIRVHLSEDIVDSIHSNKAKFTAFLKKNNYQQVGRFNPWQIVNEISDEILDNCMEEVSEELWAINNEIVEHTYKQEFKNGGGTPESNDESIAS